MDAEEIYRSPATGDPERTPQPADLGQRALAGAAVGQAGLGLWALALAVAIVGAIQHAQTPSSALLTASGVGKVYAGFGLTSLVVAAGLLRSQRWACWAAVGLASAPLLLTLALAGVLTANSGLDGGLLILLLAALAFAGHAAFKAKRLLGAATRTPPAARGWLRPSLQALREAWPDLVVAGLVTVPALAVIVSLQLSDR